MEKTAVTGCVENHYETTNFCRNKKSLMLTLCSCQNVGFYTPPGKFDIFLQSPITFCTVIQYTGTNGRLVFGPHVNILSKQTRQE